MKKKKDIYHEKKIIIIFDAVGWKSYCSRLWSWARHRARGWADCAQQALGERACWTCKARAAGGLERAWRAGRAGARRAAGALALEGARALAGERARTSGSWACGRALGARQGAGRAVGRH